MKKLFTLLALVFSISFYAYAQETPVKSTEAYSKLRIANKFLSDKLYAYVDFGEGIDVLKDDQGKPIYFVSTVAALNYMNSKGWELVNSHVVIDGSNSYTYYIMKRKI